MGSPKGRLTVAALALWALAGPAQAQQCMHHQNGNSPGMSFTMQQMTNALQPQMSPMFSTQSMTAQMSSPSQAPMGRFGSSACQMSRMSSTQSMTSTMTSQTSMCQSRLSRMGPFPTMQSQTSFLQPLQLQQIGVQPLEIIALQQQQLVQQQQLIALQQQQLVQQQKHLDALLKTDQLKTLRLQMTTLQGQLTGLQSAQPGALQPTALNDLQRQVNTLQDQLNGVSKPPKALVRQMSDLQDEMSSLQQRVTATPADLIAVLRNAGK